MKWYEFCIDSSWAKKNDGITSDLTCSLMNPHDFGLFLAGIGLKPVLNICLYVMETTGSPFRAQMRWHLSPLNEWFNLLTIDDPFTHWISYPHRAAVKNVGPESSG